MKTILVPSDFSACAANATDVAVNLAQRFGATLHLYTRIDLPRNWESFTEAEKEKHPEALQNIRNVGVLMKDLQNQNPTVAIETAYSGGNLTENINEYVKKHGVDFVVMGSHGKSGKNEFFMGSNTQRAVRMVHCPVLVIKDKLKRTDFKKVVYPSAFNSNDKEAFLKFKDFIKHFIPEIHLVAIQTSSLFDAPLIVQQSAMEDFRKLAEPFDCKTHILRDFSIDKGVRFFADEIGADLIAVSNHHRHPVKRIFTGSNVEALVNHSEIPVLSIDFEEG